MTIKLCIQNSRLRKRASATIAVGLSALLSSAIALSAAEDEAKRIYERLTGSYPSETKLAELTALVSADNGMQAALDSIDDPENHSFYNVTLKNWASPWTNRESDVFAELNDYTTTVIGFVRDDLDFRGVLYQDLIYRGRSGLGLPAFSPANNDHYAALEAGLDLDGDPGFSLKDDIDSVAQSTAVPALATAGAVNGASGVVTTRAGAKAFLIAGTNRAAFRFTMLNHLCLDMEQVHDVTRTPDRIRQDVSRSPGGDSRIFLSTCIGCHSGMDPLAQSLAYHNYAYDPEADPTGENGQVEYTPGVVQPKYFNNEATFPPGFITPDDQWKNYWREGQNSVLGWDLSKPSEGRGASSMFEELAHTDAFAQCHVKRVFKTVCLRDPENGDDRALVNDMVASFKTGGNMKNVFAASANHCKGDQPL